MDNKAVKNVFINLHDDIVKGINPDPIIDSLLSRNVITTDDYCELREVANPRNRCRDLLKLLYRCTHPETFVQLRLALRDQYPWIVDEIDKQLTPHARLPQRREEHTIKVSSTSGLNSALASTYQPARPKSFSESSPMSDNDEQRKPDIRSWSSSSLLSFPSSLVAAGLRKLKSISFRQVVTRAGVVKQIKTGCSVVLSVTSLDNEVFVLLKQDINQVAVYSINDYQLLRHLNIPEYKPHCYSDITSCVRRRCLYMSACDNCCVHRYELASRASSEWPLRGRPLGLSVTPSGNLLVTFCWPNKLVELSGDSGQRVREITLQAGVRWPWHSVQLTTGQLVVCRGLENDNLHQVCVVGDDGRVGGSYGGQRGSDVGQLHSPRYMAVDKDSQSLYVADENNGRVVMLSATLEFVRYVVEGLSRPHHVYFDHTARRLYVCQLSDRYVVTVIQL